MTGRRGVAGPWCWGGTGKGAGGEVEGNGMKSSHGELWKDLDIGQGIVPVSGAESRKSGIRQVYARRALEVVKTPSTWGVLLPDSTLCLHEPARGWLVPVPPAPPPGLVPLSISVHVDTCPWGDGLLWSSNLELHDNRRPPTPQQL